MAKITKDKLDNVKKKTTQKIRSRTMKFSKGRIIAFVICAIIIGLSFLFTTQLENYINFSINKINITDEVGADDLKIHYIDVGQGDCTFIELPDGKNMIIDTGSRSSATELANYIGKVILTDDKTIDYMILTHSDEDHIGGSVTIFDRFDVLNVYRPNIYSKSETAPDDATIHSSDIYDKAISSMYKETNHILYNEAGIIIDGEDYNLMFYGPLDENYDDVNDYSPILIFTYKEKTFMFTGDASSSVEEDFVNNYTAIPEIDVLKTGHHGSKTSTSDELLSATSPDFAVISCGEDNKYGHPNEETLTRLKNVGATILRTDLNGSILFFVNDNGEIVYQIDTYVPNTYYIKWWYVATTLGVIVIFICFFSKKIKLKKWHYTINTVIFLLIKI